VITRIGAGMYRVEHDGRSEIVYVAGPVDDRWVFWNGAVYRGDGRAGGASSPAWVPIGPKPHSTVSVIAPMPARVIRILAAPGAGVKKGDTLMVLEAMKMELPLRAPGEARVAAVHCREGELVQADAVLVDLGPP
jgi:biotin carboxyl carrier protein